MKIYQIRINKKFYLKDLSGEYVVIKDNKYYTSIKEVLYTTQPEYSKSFINYGEVLSISEKISGEIIEYKEIGE